MTLKDKLQTLVDASDFEMGLAVQHIESGEICHLNADTFFPMASVLKIPVLATAFQQLEQGYFRLEDRWTLQDDHKRRGSGILPFFNDGLTPTVQDCLTLMMIISDNTATDMVIDRLGGPLAIEQSMHDLGLTDIHLKLTIQELLQDCLPDPDPDLDEADQEKAFFEIGYIRDGVAFSRGPENDVSTPAAMTQLVSLLFLEEVVNSDSTERLFDILCQQQFNDRLPRFFPPGTKFAHKTGTLAGVRNDSGLVYINEDSHVAITLYTIWDDEAVWEDPIATYERIFAVETAMGQMGRLIYDHFS